jgi:glycosyltransferase involved in cell wall biosynthesis
MKVSVVIPTYNGGDFIEATLASVLNQTFTDFEVVVSDDASTDGTIPAVESVEDPRLTISGDRSHVGPGGNWNRAVALARGEYVKVLAQDDVLYPNNLEVSVGVLDADPALSFVATRRDIIGVDGTVLMHGRGLSGLCGRIAPIKGVRTTVRTGANQFGEGAAVLFRRMAANETGGFDDSLPYAIDIDFWLRLLAWGPAFGVCASHAAFRISGQSWSNALVREQGAQFAALIDRVAGDPTKGATRSDVLIGKARARANAQLRQLFYTRHRSRL